MYARSRAGPARDRTHRPSPTAARGHWVRDTLSLSRLWSQRFRRRRSALTHRLHTRRTDTCTPDGHAGPRARLQKSQRKEVRLDTPRKFIHVQLYTINCHVVCSCGRSCGAMRCILMIPLQEPVQEVLEVGLRDA